MSLRIGILTVSDRVAAGQMDDRGGPEIERALGDVDATVEQRAIVADERDRIAQILRTWVTDGLDVIFTTGGTGLGPRDVTADATTDICDRLVPGMAEAIRAEGVTHTPFAMLSRGVVGTRAQTLIINLPGSPTGAAEGAAYIAPLLSHAIAIMHGGKH